MHLLVVEDDKGTRDCLDLVLSTFGKCTYAFASTNDEAIEAIFNTFPHTIILDIFLKEGFVTPVIKYIRSIKDYFPKLILISGITDASKFAKEHNIEILLTKPFNLDELHDVIFN